MATRRKSIGRECNMSRSEPKIQEAEWSKAAGLALYRATELLQNQADELELIEDHIQEAMRVVQTVKALRKMIQIESSLPGLIDRFRAEGIGVTSIVGLKKAIESAQPRYPISLADAKRMIEIATLRNNFGKLDARIFGSSLLNAPLEALRHPKSTAHLSVWNAARKSAGEQGIPCPSSEDISTFREYWGHVALYGDLPNASPAPDQTLADENGGHEAARQRPTA